MHIPITTSTRLGKNISLKEFYQFFYVKGNQRDLILFQKLKRKRKFLIETP